MNATILRLGLGLVLMAVVCSAAYRAGDRPVRLAVLLITVSWVASAAIQLVTGLLAEPVITADVICGLGFLALAWTQGRRWPWLLVVVQSALFFLHATLYRSGRPPSLLEIVGNNLLVIVGLVVVLVAAFMTRRRPAPS